MAMVVSPQLIGIDVSKAGLDLCTQENGPVQTIANEAQVIGRWLANLPANACLAVEATNTYHLALVEQAHAAGHTVYIIDGYRLNRYRESVGGRAKTDASDARLLWRYLARERADLRPWTPPSAGYQAIQRLLHRRATLVQAKVAIEQSLADLPELKRSAAALLRQWRQLDAVLQKRLRQLVRDHEWEDDVRRCEGIEGVGPLTGTALAMAFRRGQFRSSDAFVAFLGLDVRVRDSGQKKGQRRLTKQGDPELRRLLHLAAMQASRSVSWRAFYQRHLDRGLSKTQALVALARKLARVAFALLKNQADYRPKSPSEACVAT